MALITPPLPAASRPSKTMTTRCWCALTQSCSAHSSTCSARSSLSYSLRLIGRSAAAIGFLLSCASSRASAAGAHDPLLRLHEEEEGEAAQEERRPDAERDRLGGEELLHRTRVREEQLQ